MCRDYVEDILIISFMILSISLSVLLLFNLKSLNNDSNKNCEICCCNFDKKTTINIIKNEEGS